MTLSVDGRRRSALGNHKSGNPKFDTSCWVSVLLIVVGGVLLFVRYEDAQQEGNLAATGSVIDLPSLLLIVWLALSFAALIRSYTKACGAETADELKSREIVALLPIATVTLVMAIGTVYLGYLIPVGLGLPIVMWMLGERRPVQFIFSYLVLGPGLWFLFHHVLEIRLPSLLSGGMF